MTAPSWPELVIDVGHLLRRDNIADLKRRSIDGSDVVALDVVVAAEGLNVSTAGIPDGSEVAVQAELRSTMRGVEASIKATSRWEGECRRCLETVSAPVEIDTAASFLPDIEGAEELSETDAEAYPISNERVDLGEVLREELFLALPLSPLCADDCRGADPERFPTGGWAGSEGDDDEEREIDPRWAALSALSIDEE